MADAHLPRRNERVQFIEPFAVADTLVTDIAEVCEISPDLFRVTLGTRMTSVIDGRQEYLISDRIVMTGDVKAKLVDALSAASNRQPVRLRLPDND